MTIEEFTERVNDLLEKVQHGLEVTIYRADKAVATIRPTEGLVFSNLADPARPLRDIDLGTPPRSLVSEEVLELLFQDREKDRNR